MNNNDPMRNVMGVPSSFGNSGLMQPPQNHQQGHILSQSQPQIRQGGPHFPGHFQLNDPHAQMRAAQAQFAQVHAQVQAQTANSRFPTQYQFQSPAHFQNLNTGNLGVSNANVSSPPVSTTPGSGSARRASQRPPSRPIGSSNPNAPSPLKTMELTPAASRKKRKLPEMQIPDKVAAILPESALYTQLLEFEAKVDSLLSRKKSEIQEAVRNPSRVQKVLRIYIFNTFANQTGSTSEEAKDAEPPSWSLKIIGRILENGKDPVVEGLVPNPATTSHAKFSSFFKKITIYLDQNLYPDNHVILWESDRAPALHEGFEVRRKGDKEFTSIIRLEMNHDPEKFKLSPALSELIGVDVDTRQRVLAAIWLYVKAKKLQSPSDPSTFMCDPPLQKLFGEEKMKFVFVPQKMSSHLTALQPIHLEHKIKLSGNSPAGTTCYDVLVDAPLPLEKDMSAFLASLERHKDIDACDEVISSSIKKIQEHRRRRAFFRGFSQSPAEFINSMIASQSKDLKLAAGDALHNLDKERHSDFYNLPWVEDAVIRYLNRKSAVGSEGPSGS